MRFIERLYRAVTRRLYGRYTFRQYRQRRQLDKIYKRRPYTRFPVNSYVLIDGAWDNPNHWNRMSLFGRALNEHYKTNRLAMVEAGASRPINLSVRSLRIDCVEVIRSDEAVRKKAHCLTNKLFNRLKTPVDLLRTELPFKVPGCRLYDYVLMRQRLPEVQWDGLFEELTERFMLAILQNVKLLETYDIRAIACSHTISLRYSSLVWIAIQRGIPCYQLDNHAGSIRAKSLNTIDDYFSPHDAPTSAYRTGLSPVVRGKLINLGQQVLHERLNGSRLDLSGRLAYDDERPTFTREELCKFMGLNTNLPIVAIMMPNWFDYPHTFEFSGFDNIADWLRVVCNTIKDRRDINWIIKTHPAASTPRYEGPTVLGDVLGESLAAVFPIFDTAKWNSITIMNAVDGILTPYGTSGIEYAATGKKVLLGGKSFYSDWGFCTEPESRKDFVRCLMDFPQKMVVTHEMQEDALIFLALFLGTEQGSNQHYLYPSDHLADDLYDILPEFMRQHSSEIEREVETMKTWLSTDYQSYNAFKVLRSYKNSSLGIN